MNKREGQEAPGVSYGGALSVLLRPDLAHKLKWPIDAGRPSDEVFEAAETGVGVSRGERVQCAIAIGIWGGNSYGVDVALIGTLDGAALGRLGRLLCAMEEGKTWQEWGTEERCRPMQDDGEFRLPPGFVVAEPTKEGLRRWHKPGTPGYLTEVPSSFGRGEVARGVKS